MESPVYEYILTKRDFINAQKLYRSHRRWTAVAYYIWFWMLPILGVCAILPFLYGLATHDRNMMGSTVSLAAAGCYFALLIPILRYFQIRKLWNAAVPKKVQGKPVTLQFDEEQIISGIPGRSEGRFQWSGIVDYAENETIGLIFIRKKLFLFIPRQALPEEAWLRIRELAPKEFRKDL